MQIDNIISKIENLRENKQNENMQTVIADLEELRKVLLEEIAEEEKNTPKTIAPSGDLDKANYRIEHLAKNYKELYEQSEKEKAELQKTIEKLNYRVEVLKRHIKIE